MDIIRDNDDHHPVRGNRKLTNFFSNAMDGGKQRSRKSWFHPASPSRCGAHLKLNTAWVPNHDIMLGGGIQRAEVTSREHGQSGHRQSEAFIPSPLSTLVFQQLCRLLTHRIQSYGIYANMTGVY